MAQFEPPSISGSESQNVIELLHVMYIETGERKYLDAAAKAIAYLKKSELPGGKLARFYELQTNRPLYFVKETYELTYNDDALPTHYAFKVGSRVAGLQEENNKLKRYSAKELTELREYDPLTAHGILDDLLSADAGQVRRIIAAQDKRGAWVESGKLRYHGKSDDTREVIETKTFIKNVETLAESVAWLRTRGGKK